MNKKFLSAILFGAFMVGSSVTFTGCIDNDEPAGIEELRGAKAELIKAKVAVEAANAAYRTAEAEKVKAEAANVAAEAEIIKAQAEAMRLQNELQSALNEEEKARIEAELTTLQQQMEEAALRHQASMVQLQQALAEAQREYEIALKQIEIAVELASESEKITIFQLKSDVANAEREVNYAMLAVEQAEANFYQASLSSKVDSVSWKQLELNIRDAKAAQKIAEENLAKWQDFLKNDTETATWRAEITEIEDTLEALEKAKKELEVELVKLQNSEEYKNLIDAVREASKPIKLTEDLSYTYTYTKEDILDFATGVDETGKQEIKKDAEVADVVVTIGGNDADGEGGYIKELSNEIASYTAQKKALLDELAEGDSIEVAKLKKESEDAVKAWKEAKAKYDAVGDYDAETALETVTEAETTYNDADKSDATKELAALNAYAKALVKYYTDANTYVGCETNKVKLSINQPVGPSKEVEKAIAEWLSDEDYSGAYLKEIMAKGFSTTALYQVGASKGIKTMGDKDELLTKLEEASLKAFGPAAQYANIAGPGYLLVEPTLADLEYVGLENAGAAGKYQYALRPEAEYEAKNYEAIIADYEEALEYWTEQLTALNEDLEEAEEAKEAAEDAIEAYEEENFEGTRKQMGDIDGQYVALEAIKDALTDAVETYLGTSYDSTADFIEWLNEQVANAERLVISKEEAVVRAENDLIEAKDGKYDYLSICKRALDDAMAELEEAQAELEEALADLAKGLEIMAGTAAE